MAVFLFFGLAYPHHLHYQEQYQLFLFDNTYVWEIVRQPGGIADLLGRFCTQFFLFAWVGALIIAVLLSAVQLLTLRLLNGQWSMVNGQQSTVNGQRFYGLTFVPSFLLWLFLLDENALLSGVWAVLLTLLAVWAIIKLPGKWTRCILLIAAIPILYYLVGPVCFPIPIDSLWHGIHYHRYPTLFPWLLWAAALSALVIILLGRLGWEIGGLVVWSFRKVTNGGGNIPKRPNDQTTKRCQRTTDSTDYSDEESVKSVQSAVKTKRPNDQTTKRPNDQTTKRPNDQSRRSIVTVCSFLLVAAGMGYLVWKNSNFKAEKVMKYDFMACHQQWNRILETINTEKPNNQIGVTVQNLALAMRGMLLDHLFDYNQNGIAGLLPDVKTDATSPLPTAEAFYQLGMINVAQRTVFEAQEAILDFQKSARCYKRLAQTNLINGNYAVARKYLAALQKTLFYREWANETLQLLGNEEAIAQHPEYGHLRQWAYKEDFYFSDHVTPEMLESLYTSNGDNSLAYQYLLAYYLLTGDRESFNHFISNKQ